MALGKELLRMLLVLFITVLLVAFLWQVPYFMAILLLIPLGLSVFFWPDGSTFLSYMVGALVGTLFTAWSVLDAVQQPANLPLTFIWLPLVWGPAGVLVKRLELIVKSMFSRGKYELPKV